MSAVAATEPISTTNPSASKPTAADQALALERAKIDAGVSGPVLTFFTSALAWLLIATVFGFINGLKVHNPEFLDSVAILSYGRTVPAYNLSFLFGWASMAGIGVGIWLMARLCRIQVRYPGFLTLAALFWNFGLLLAVVGVLMGNNTGLVHLELPPKAAWVMFVGYAFVGIWGISAYLRRRDLPVFISVWYLLAAFVWFAGLLLFTYAILPQANGVIQNVVAAWFSHTLLLYWFTPLALGAAYYLIPKVINQPIRGYNLATIGFWSWTIFAGLTAGVKLTGGPVPVWLPTISIASSIMMIVPIVTITTNLVTTMRGKLDMVAYSPTVRFTFFGAISFAVATAIGVVGSLRSFDRAFHFSQYQEAHQHLMLYAFFSMIMFGAIYYIAPRLVGCEWLSRTLMKLHFLGSAYGGGLVIISLLLSGLAFGFTIANPESTYAQAIQVAQIYSVGRIVGLILLTIGHTFFGLHFLLMLLRIGQPGGQPTLLATPGEDHH